MIRNVLTAALTSAAMIVAAPALAHPGGPGGSGGAGAGAAGAMSRAGPGGFGGSATGNFSRGAAGDNFGSGVVRLGGEGSFGTRPSISNQAFGPGGRGVNFDRQFNRQVDRQIREPGQVTAEGVSQAFFHASPTAFAHASPNSILARGALPSALFPGLTTGLTVDSSTGAMLGRVTGVLTTSNGAIAGVIVTGANGQTFRVPASALSISGNVVTVNTAAFESGAVPAALLPGLTTGLTVDSSTGTTLGTITNVQMGRNGTISSVTVTAANGQTYVVPANALSISGHTVTVNSAEAFEASGVPASLLPGLSTGLTVDSSGGTSLGTISRVNMAANGNITSVVVTTAGGQTYVLPASALTISGGTVTVNTAEAFEGAGVPSAFLPGLTSGLTVDTSTGATLGTISQVVMGRNGTINGVYVSSNGQTYFLPASDLSISGNVVTVSTVG